jgi:hypothetical protein
MAIGCCMRGCGGGAEEHSDRVFRHDSRYLTGNGDSLAIDVILPDRDHGSFAGHDGDRPDRPERKFSKLLFPVLVDAATVPRALQFHSFNERPKSQTGGWDRRTEIQLENS